MRQILALFTPLFWCQAIATIRFFIYGNVRAITALGRRGENTQISPSARFGYPENVYLGNNCSINHNCHIYAGSQSKLTIGDETLLGPGVFITTDSFSRSMEDREGAHSGHEEDIKIGKNVRIGAKVVILPGVIIGDNAAVGAGSVVTESIPTGKIAVGNPARVVKSVV